MNFYENKIQQSQYESFCNQQEDSLLVDLQPTVVVRDELGFHSERHVIV